jgi:hypothetical protein
MVRSQKPAGYLIFDVIYNIFPNKKTGTGNLYSRFIKLSKFTAKSVTRIVSKTLYLRGSGNNPCLMQILN